MSSKVYRTAALIFIKYIWHLELLFVKIIKSVSRWIYCYLTRSQRRLLTYTAQLLLLFQWLSSKHIRDRNLSHCDHRFLLNLVVINEISGVLLGLNHYIIIVWRTISELLRQFGISLPFHTRLRPRLPPTWWTCFDRLILSAFMHWWHIFRKFPAFRDAITIKTIASCCLWQANNCFWCLVTAHLILCLRNGRADLIDALLHLWVISQSLHLDRNGLIRVLPVLYSSHWDPLDSIAESITAVSTCARSLLVLFPAVRVLVAQSIRLASESHLLLNLLTPGWGWELTEAHLFDVAVFLLDLWFQVHHLVVLFVYFLLV